uniref:hypothetical protein n=1 Tax=Thaumasiovibrio occultus TaxID=1891184 RepID=UPI000B362E08|nr:hypothetical protein [Thaumasiovibrio occultus]
MTLEDYERLVEKQAAQLDEIVRLSTLCHRLQQQLAQHPAPLVSNEHTGPALAVLPPSALHAWQAHRTATVFHDFSDMMKKLLFLSETRHTVEEIATQLSELGQERCAHSPRLQHFTIDVQTPSAIPDNAQGTIQGAEPPAAQSTNTQPPGDDKVLLTMEVQLQPLFSAESHTLAALAANQFGEVICRAVGNVMTLRRVVSTLQLGFFSYPNEIGQITLSVTVFLSPNPPSPNEKKKLATLGRYNQAIYEINSLFDQLAMFGMFAQLRDERQ